jgi:hypothetical protein
MRIEKGNKYLLLNKFLVAAEESIDDMIIPECFESHLVIVKLLDTKEEEDFTYKEIEYKCGDSISVSMYDLFPAITLKYLNKRFHEVEKKMNDHGIW